MAKEVKKVEDVKDKNYATRKKDYRKEGYMRIDEDPLLKTADLQPRLINIDQFVESRAFELKHFVNILKVKAKSNNKLPFQSLPRHMRRRTMSHNYYRVPLRLRYADTLERIKEKAGDAVSRSRCRRHLRKPKYLLAEYRKRAHNADTGRWLETHIWHAKRFHMANLWGYKIANHCNDKSERASYKFAAHDCVFIDKSYYQWIWINSKDRDVLAKLISMHSYRPIPAQATSGKKVFNTLWMTEDKQVIAPVFIIFKPGVEKGTQGSCIICVHPASSSEIVKSIQVHVNQDIQVELLDDSSLSLFQLNGKRAMQAVANVLLPLALPGQQILELVEKIEDPAILPNGAIIGLKLRKPKSTFRMNESILKKEKNLADLKAADQYVLFKRKCDFSLNSNVQKEISEILLNWDEKFARCDLWNREYLRELVANLDITGKITTRSRFAHKKKKGDLQKLLARFKALKVKPKEQLPSIKEEKEKEHEEKKKEHEEKEKEHAEKKKEHEEKEKEHAEEVKEAPLQIIKDVPANSKIPESKMEDVKSAEEKNIWMWIIIESSTNNKRPFGAGLKLIFPAGASLNLLRRLIYAGAKPIGLKEHNSIAHEKSLFVYPNDFPLTKPYDSMQTTLSIEKATRYYRKPPSKRLNYQKIGFPYPFISLWQDLIPKGFDPTKLIISPLSSKNTIFESSSLALCPVQINMIKRYVPKEGAIICVPIGTLDHKMSAEPTHEIEVNNKQFNKEFERITGKSSVELYDKEGKVSKKCKKKSKRSKKREELQKILHPECKNEEIKKTEAMNDVMKEEKKIINNETVEQKIVTKELKIIVKTKDLTENCLKYKIIGFVTSGGFSLLEGRGSGIGYIMNYQGSGIAIKDNQICGFTRNPNSRFYHPCILTLINLPYAC